ncbi:MAG: hypothetical protein IKY58_04865, partial [Paludibacteraceae bacterium]|nr:hypothetical protein [Paludibacteraceae bacterium]
MIKHGIKKLFNGIVFFLVFFSLSIPLNAHTFASNSVLSKGKWVKISVKESGLCRISFMQLQQMGFSKPSEVRVFGFGGELLFEDFSQDYKDDLSEVTLYQDASSIVFYAKGPKNWQYMRGSNNRFDLSINHYSNYGYYFLTDGAGEKRRIK